MKTWDNTVRSGMSVDFAVVRCDACRCLVPIHWDDAHEVDYCDTCIVEVCPLCNVHCPGGTGVCDECLENPEYVGLDGTAMVRS